MILGQEVQAQPRPRYVNVQETSGSVLTGVKARN